MRGGQAKRPRIVGHTPMVAEMPVEQGVEPRQNGRGGRMRRLWGILGQFLRDLSKK